jgi:hypothetical protein
VTLRHARYNLGRGDVNACVARLAAGKYVFRSFHASLGGLEVRNISVLDEMSGNLIIICEILILLQPVQINQADMYYSVVTDRAQSPHLSCIVAYRKKSISNPELVVVRRNEP